MNNPIRRGSSQSIHAFLRKLRIRDQICQWEKSHSSALFKARNMISLMLLGWVIYANDSSASDTLISLGQIWSLSSVLMVLPHSSVVIQWGSIGDTSLKIPPKAGWLRVCHSKGLSCAWIMNWQVVSPLIGYVRQRTSCIAGHDSLDWQPDNLQIYQYRVLTPTLGNLVTYRNAKLNARIISISRITCLLMTFFMRVILSNWFSEFREC